VGRVAAQVEHLQTRSAYRIATTQGHLEHSTRPASNGSPGATP
jgi:hypothetical protein